MDFVWSERSARNFAGVHPDLVSVMSLALSRSRIDFGITEGLRNSQRQMELYHAGASKTLRSRHITGHAVDIVAYVQGEVRWDWPLYEQIAKTVRDAAADLYIPVIWGGSWESFRDGPHFELDRAAYP